MNGCLEVSMSNKLYQRNLPVPFFSQRDNKYEWVRKNLNGTEVPNTRRSLAYMTCNITSLCMLLHYFGITTDTPDEMLRKVFETWSGTADFSIWEDETSFNTWRTEAAGYNRLTKYDNLEKIATIIYGVKAIERSDIKTLEKVQEDYISRGYPVLMSFGPLWDPNDPVNYPIGEKGQGHISVIRGFTEKDDVIINDPWGDVASPFGYLRRSSETAGLYISSSVSDEYPKYYGLGSGDNCVIKKDEFKRIMKDSGNRFHATMVIKYSHLWSFPLRKTAGEKLCMGKDAYDESKGETAESYRAEQINTMSKFEILRHAGFPIAELGAWHNGIHIKGSGDTPVYPIGPGRLIAAQITTKNTENRSSPCFALLQHPLVTGGQKVFFYSYYMHLRPMEMTKQMILSRLIPDDRAESVDWLEQIIKYVRPKKAVVYAEGNKSSDNRPKIYKLDGNTMIDTGAKLPKGSLFRAYSDLNDRTKYIYKTVDDGKEYYGFYYWEGNQLTTRYVEITYKTNDNGQLILDANGKRVENHAIRPQRINIREYMHYRKKLISLINGEKVTFTGEDRDTNHEAAQTKKSPGTVLQEAMEEEFPEFGLTLTMNTAAKFNNVTTKYLEKSPANTSELQTILSGLYNHYVNIAKNILTRPENSITSPFKLNEDWHKKMSKSLEDVIKGLSVNYVRYEIDKNKEDIIPLDGKDWAEENSNAKFGYKQFFYNLASEIFETEVFADYKNGYKKIIEYYKAGITAIKNTSSSADSLANNKSILCDEIIEKCARLKNTLLAWTPSREDNRFKVDKNEKWDDGLKAMVKELIELLYQDDIDNEKDRLESAMAHFHPVNMDFHIEVNTNTQIGIVGEYMNRDQTPSNEIHVSVFSRNKLLDGDTGVVHIEDDKRGPFTDCHENVKKLKEGLEKANVLDHELFTYLDDNIITEEERSNFLLKKGGTVRKIMLTRLNSLNAVSQEEYDKMMETAHGYRTFHNSELFDIDWYNTYMLLNGDDIKKELECYNSDFNTGKALTYFHPVGFLEWLDKNKE